MSRGLSLDLQDRLDADCCAVDVSLKKKGKERQRVNGQRKASR